MGDHMTTHTHTDDSGTFECPMGAHCEYKRPLRAGSLVAIAGSESVIVGRLEHQPYDWPKHWLVRFRNGTAQIMSPEDFMP